jgi:hypothetical protein
MIDLILVVTIVLGAVGYLVLRAVQKPKHGCPDCEVSKLRQK